MVEVAILKWVVTVVKMVMVMLAEVVMVEMVTKVVILADTLAYTSCTHLSIFGG